MGLFSYTCAKCGTKVKKDAAFCSACGTAAPGGISRCGRCNTEVRGLEKFCGRCGADLQVYAPIQVVNNRWMRSEEEFVVRVEASDLEGWLRKGLIVEPGTQAVLIQRGRCAGILQSGRHELDGFLNRVNNFNLKSPAAAILMSTTDTLMPLEFPQLSTREGLPVSVRCQVILALANPEHVAFHLMAGRERITVAELKETLVDEARNVLQALISQVGIEELYGNLDFKAQVEERLQDELGRTLERSGLELVQLHFIDYAGEDYERLRQMRGETHLASREAEELGSRAEIAQRLRQTLTQERMAEFKDATELEEFIRQQEHELGLKDIIRTHEMEDLKRTFCEEQEDRDMTRRHILERVELEHTLALRKMKLEADINYDAVQLETELERGRKEFEHKLKMEKEEAQQDFEEAQQGLELLRRMKEVKSQEQRAQREMEREDKRLEAELKERELEARSRVSTEALIATSSPEQARILAELESIRLKGNLTEEQMIALAAEKSPDMAKALAEKYRAQGGATDERLKDMEERMRAERESAERHADRIERLMHESMGNITRLGEAYARAAGSQPEMATGSGEQARVGSATSARKVLLCPKCQEENEFHDHFCKRCG